MTPLSDRLQTALASDCATSVEEYLEDRSPGDVEELLAALAASEGQEERTRIVYLLARFADARAAPDLIRALPGLDEHGRCRAADALGRMGGDDAVAALDELAGDASPHVRKFAAYGLGRCGDERARKTLGRLRDTDDEDFVRRVAGRTLDQSK